MSGEDDNFDIDIYGDAEQQDASAQGNNHIDDLNFGDDSNFQYDGANDTPAQNDSARASDTTSQQPRASSFSAQAGTKRKAEDHDFDDHPPAAQENSTAYTSNHPQSQNRQPSDPHATVALKLGELHWWTTEEDLRLFCARTGVEDQLQDLSFGEHKINGKSRGEAYLEFSTPYAADAVKREIERKEPAKDGQSEPKKPHPFTVWFTSPNNPFKGRDSGAIGKKDTGAYNSFGNRGGGDFRGRGGFDRGRGGFRGGGGYQNRGGFQNNNNNNNMAPQGGFNPAMGGMGGFANPMMGMGNMMGNMMGMGNLARGGMMGGRGGFGMGNMGMGGMMPQGRGGMMNQRGGWGGGGGFPQGGGMQGGSYGGGGGGGYGQQQQQQQQPPNKRMKPE
ncbi:hypothetical protein DOTSEDRAFT_66706 [Dothistroma septosporum NZE10]|uniref:RRM domain-containing protein n=1 Tax=Dothistroma septosporum (strain NZE10 / CBS 128990) TaxID=675120 RepID=M2YID1_DOTSN|nr:hypothetical protein DOTSEDRAFT_66706 [Dothistroma septosporum NZE10]